MTEFDFIDNIRLSFAGIGDGSITGIGDDCAVIPISDGESLAVTTDMLVEGVHFLRHAITPRELGAKSLAVNLSDVAAMGARPLASFLSIALPAECRGEWADEFMEGYREMSARYGVKLAGGDTTSSNSGIAVNVTLIGRASNDRLKFRSGARAGDIVAVNGALGESAAGLRDILNGRLDTPFARTHRNPTPQVAEGEWLGGCKEVHAMIDLSDGLASDLLHILRASSGEIKSSGAVSSGINGTNADLDAGSGAGRNASAGTTLGAQIELGDIPTVVPMELAVAGGEDYKLLFTVSPEGWEHLRADYEARFGSEPHHVGRITEGAPEIVWMDNGSPVKRDWHGFTHF